METKTLNTLFFRIIKLSKYTKKLALLTTVSVVALLSIPVGISYNSGCTFGTDGTDIMKGTNFGDCLNGMDGDDKMWGADGSDTLVPGNGKDQVRAGPGDDTIFVEDDGFVDFINCGRGAEDTVDYADAGDLQDPRDVISANCETILED